MISLNAISQNKIGDLLSKELSTKTDSLIQKYKLDVKDINLFEELIKLNGYTTCKDSIYIDYARFYQCITNSDNLKSNYKNSDKIILILKDFAKVFYPLNHELGILHEKYYQTIDSEIKEIKLCEIGAASEICPVPIEFKTDEIINKNLFREYKVFLLSYFGSFENIDLILKKK